MEKKKIGFAGLGNMGKQMASRILAAGYPVTVYNRTESKAQELVVKGAKLAKQPRDLADCDFVLTMLADDKALEGVVTGQNGFASSLKKGATHIAMGTISIELSHKLAELHHAAGQGFVGAPVLGRPDAAEAGKLTVLCAGPSAADCDPLFEAIGQKTVHLGSEAWRAHLAKLAFNFMLASAVETMSEAIALTRKGGIEAKTFYDLFTDTLFACPVYKNYGGMIVNEKFKNDEGFRMTLAAKDLRLVLAAGDQLKVPMPTASTVRDQMLQAIGRGHEDYDWAGLGKMAAENAGL